MNENVEKREKQNSIEPMDGGPMGHGRGAGEKAKNFKKSLGQLIKYLKPHYVSIIISIVFAIGSTVFSIVGPKYLGRMTDEIINGLFPGASINYSAIATIGIMLVIFYVASAIFGYIQNFLLAGVSAKTGKNLRTKISQKINKLPLKYFDGQSTGDVLSRVTNDVDTIGQTLNQSLPEALKAVTSIVGMLIMMFSLCWQLSFVPIATIPLSLVFLVGIVIFSQKFFVKQQKTLGAVNGHIEEIYSAHTIVRAFNYQDAAKDDFSKLNKELYGNALKSQFFSGLIMPVFKLLGNLGVIAVCVFGANLALGGAISIGIIVSFLTYAQQFMYPVADIAQIATVLQSTAAASERVFEFLNEPEQEPEQNKLPAIETVNGEVEFNNVNFGYNPDKQIIFDFNLKTAKGQKIAIVGPTGAGKTTIVNLLMRFYETNSGDIFVDGIKSKDMKREDMRKMFSMVLQDTWLFEGTIAENVAYANKNASQNDIETACKMANIDHFINTLPNGYNTVLSEESNISQGQRQLLTIARAMLQNAPMLILDEATSSVDTRTEILIQEAMDRLTKGRTSFVIAHRLSTIKNADVILVMRDGNIIEQGNHENLLTQKGFYAELYNSQFSQNGSMQSTA